MRKTQATGNDGPAKLQAISRDARYAKLVRTRSRLAWLLTSIILVIYFGYILLIAFRRDIMALPLGDGVTSLGIPLGLGVILSGIVLTGIYVRRANRDYDPLIDALKRDYSA